jgi:hypothetical protein
MRVLVAGRHAKLLAQAAGVRAHDLSIETVEGKAAAFALLDATEFDLVIACERLVDGCGLEVLSHVAVNTPDALRVFAARPSILEFLKGELGLFGLFRTLHYPINLQALWATIGLARSCLETDTATAPLGQPLTHIRHVVLESEWETAEPELIGPEPEGIAALEDVALEDAAFEAVAGGERVTAEESLAPEEMFASEEVAAPEEMGALTPGAIAASTQITSPMAVAATPTQIATPTITAASTQIVAPTMTAAPTRITTPTITAAPTRITVTAITPLLQQATQPPAAALQTTQPAAAPAHSPVRIPESEAFRRARARREAQRQLHEPVVADNSLAQLARRALERAPGHTRLLEGVRKRTVLIVGSGVFAAVAVAFLGFFMLNPTSSAGPASEVISPPHPTLRDAFPWQAPPQQNPRLAQQPVAQQPLAQQPQSQFGPQPQVDTQTPPLPGQPPPPVPPASGMSETSEAELQAQEEAAAAMRAQDLKELAMQHRFREPPPTDLPPGPIEPPSGPPVQ